MNALASHPPQMAESARSTRVWKPRLRVVCAGLALLVMCASVALWLVVGARALTVVSGSMAPAIDAGDVVVVVPTPARDIRVGDVVSFTEPGDRHRLITHRVTDLRRSGDELAVVTRGDANGGHERWSHRLDGSIPRVLFSVPKFGYVAMFVSRPLGIITLVILPAVLLIIVELRSLIRPRGEET